MPIYEYLCESCGRLSEHMQKMSDPALDKCPECGGRVARVMSRNTFRLKGSGWFKDLYGSSPKKGSGESGGGSKGGD